MRDIKSMILGNDNGGDKAKLSTAPVVQKEEAKPSEQIPSNPDPTVPVSSNGYAQAAARVNAVNDAIQGKAQVDKPDVQETASPSESTSSDHPKFRSAGDIVDEFYKKQLPSEEELIKEKKREKSRAVISAIADGVSAFSNLYFTGKGSQNVEQTSMSAANAKRYQAILDKRMKVQDEWGRSRLAASIKDVDTGNRWEQAAIERRYKEDMLKAKNDSDAAKIKTKYENDLALLNVKIGATATESEKKRKHEDKIASQRNATTIKAAGIRSGNSGNTDKEFTNISDGNGGSIRVRIKDLSPENTGKVYADMVKENPKFAVKEQGKDPIGMPLVDENKNPIMFDVPNPTESQMRAAIGRSINSSKAAQNAYREISGYGKKRADEDPYDKYQLEDDPYSKYEITNKSR
ncbi:MAG: hypothetical protein GY706_06305 [Bacteroides sp.]|nr:hypothetical protein [Bacteroides sp.]